MRICSIASGSSGNCIYIGTDATHLLVDAGISGKKTEAGLNTLGLTMRDVDGILLTHEHIDHVNGLGVLARRYGIPIYATQGTLLGVSMMKSLGEIDSSLFFEVRRGERFRIKDVDIQGIAISHDAIEPCAYRFESEGKKAAIMTDLGKYDEAIIDAISGLDALLLEANHDIRMLEAGPYPYQTKLRIMGDRGHLCNEASGQLLSKVLHDQVKEIMLMHLSKENNYPELAYETVRLEITNADNPYQADDFRIDVAKRSEVSRVLSI